jgi:hypothetical protein
MTLFPRVMEALHQRTRGASPGEQVLVFGGGIIPAADVARLKESGVAEIFGPGSTMASVCEWLEAALDRRESDLADLPDPSGAAAFAGAADLADNVLDEERARGPV